MSVRLTSIPLIHQRRDFSRWFGLPFIPPPVFPCDAMIIPLLVPSSYVFLTCCRTTGDEIITWKQLCLRKKDGYITVPYNSFMVISIMEELMMLAHQPVLICGNISVNSSDALTFPQKRVHWGFISSFTKRTTRERCICLAPSASAVTLCNSLCIEDDASSLRRCSVVVIVAFWHSGHFGYCMFWEWQSSGSKVKLFLSFFLFFYRNLEIRL